MDELKKFKPDTKKPKKKIDAQGYDEDCVLHDKCGTDECCNSCDTEENKDGRV